MSLALLSIAASAGQLAIDYTAPTTTGAQAAELQRLYPSRALRDRDSAAALMDLEVDPEGRVVACETIAVYGRKSLGERICDLQKKVRVTPATIGGQPAYGAYRTLASFYLPGETQGRDVAAVQPVASAEFTVTGLPDGRRELRLGLQLLIAPDGAVSDCRDPGNRYPAFARAACDQIGHVKFVPLKNAAGVPVQHVRGFSVEFSLAD